MEINLTFTDKEANLKLDKILDLLTQLVNQGSDQDEVIKLTADVQARATELSGAIPKPQ